MKVIDQSWSWELEPDGQQMLRLIEAAGRTCYKSEGLAGPGTAERFVESILKRGHESVVEHVSLSVRIITDRGVTHEIVRHRLASYSQESTRYCNYGKQEGVVFIKPVWFDMLKQYDSTTPEGVWTHACGASEFDYFELLKRGWTPQQARTVLNNSLKTEIVMTANIREWRHFFRLRCSKAAHPQMKALALSMLEGFRYKIPVLFDDIRVE